MENLRGILIKTENWTAHLTFLARDLIETLSITTHDGYAYVRRLTVHSCFAYSTFFHEHFNSRIVSILSIDRLQRTFDSRLHINATVVITRNKNSNLSPNGYCF